MWPNPQETSDFVTLADKFINEKLYFLWSDSCFLADTNLKLPSFLTCYYFLRSQIKLDFNLPFQSGADPEIQKSRDAGLPDRLNT